MKKQRLRKIWEGKSGALWKMWKWRWTLGIRIIHLAWKKHGSSHPHSPQIALEWCLELSTEMGAWVVASNWLGWQNAAICMKLSIQAWWSSFIVSVYLKRNASPCTATPPLRKKKSIFVLHTGYGMKKVFSSSYRKILTLIFLVTLYSNDISSAFTGLCRFLQNFYWTAAF